MHSHLDESHGRGGCKVNEFLQKDLALFDSHSSLCIKLFHATAFRVLYFFQLKVIKYLDLSQS